MKRPRSPDALPADPVLAQLDALINGGISSSSSDEIVVVGAPATLPAADPVLAQLDALINPGAAPTTAPAAPSLPSIAAPPPLLRPQEPQQPREQEQPLLPLNHPAWRHAGLLREFGGVKAWMRSLRSSGDGSAEAEP